MARKRYAVGGNLSNSINRRNYWFDENDGIVEYNNSAPEPTSNTTEEETVVQQRTTPRRTQSSTTRTQNQPANKGIVTIGTKSFNSAFRQARIAGLDKFRWNGKVYGTKLANEVGKTTKEKARNAAKPASQKPRNNVDTNRTIRSNNRLNNAKDAVRASYSRDNQGRINGQLPTATVTATKRTQSPMSWRDYLVAAQNNPSIRNTQGYKNAHRQASEYYRKKANDLKNIQNPPKTITYYRGNKKYTASSLRGGVEGTW